MSREHLLDLDRQRTSLEHELSSILSYLNGPNMPGLKGPLVDSQGFPRPDLDLYRIREMRQRFNMLNNDHLAIMKEIEREMTEYYGESREERGREGREEVEVQAVAARPAVRLEPFAWISEVTPDSPAHHSGLLVNDKVTKITSRSEGDFTALTALPTLVQQHIGLPLVFAILRTNEINQEIEMEVTITPQSWSGPGLLGCRLKPIGSS